MTSGSRRPQGQSTAENGGLSPQMTAEVEEKFKDTLRTVYAPEFSRIGYLLNTAKYPLNIREVR